MNRPKNLNKYFDHTLLKPEATEGQIKKLCAEAIEYGFYSVCVNSSYISLCKKELEGSSVGLAAVVGFPLGACSFESKAFETDNACECGASEIDVVINIGALKDKRYEYVRDEIATIVAIASEHDAIVKVILETCMLTDDEIVEACRLVIEAGAQFVKTSTGFSTRGATKEVVALMKKTVGVLAKVKASGGIRDLEKTLEMIEAGADRIGTSSSVEIVTA